MFWAQLELFAFKWRPGVDLSGTFGIVCARMDPGENELRVSGVVCEYVGPGCNFVVAVVEIREVTL